MTEGKVTDARTNWGAWTDDEEANTMNRLLTIRKLVMIRMLLTMRKLIARRKEPARETELGT